MSSSPNSSTSVRPDKITSNRHLRNRRQRLRSSSLGSLFFRKSRHRRQHKLSPSPKNLNELLHLNKHVRPHMIRTVSQEDKLLSRGANPRTGLISPSATDSLDNFTDYLESRLQQVSIPVQGKWQQDEQQWSFVQTEDESHGEQKGKAKNVNSQLRRQAPGDAELFSRYQRELQRGLEACGGNEGLADPFEAQTPQHSSSNGPSSPRPSPFKIKRKPVPHKKDASRREGSTGTVIINGKHQDTTRPALGRLIREGHVNIITPKSSPPQFTTSPNQGQKTTESFLDQQQNEIARREDVKLAKCGNYQAHEIDISPHVESYDPHWVQQTTSTPQTPKQTSRNPTPNSNGQDLRVPITNAVKISPRRVTFASTEIHYRRLPSLTDSSLTQSTNPADSLTDTLTSMSQEESSQDGILRSPKCSTAPAAPTITTTTTITPSYQPSRSQMTSSLRPEPTRLLATGCVPQMRLPRPSTSLQETNKLPSLQDPSPQPRAIPQLDVPRHRLLQPLQNQHGRVAPHNPYCIKTCVSNPADQFPYRARPPFRQRRVGSPWPTSNQPRAPLIGYQTLQQRPVSHTHRPVDRLHLTDQHPRKALQSGTQPPTLAHSLLTPFHPSLPNHTRLTKPHQPSLTPLPKPSNRSPPLRPVSLAAATAMTTHRLSSGGVLHPTHQNLLLHNGYDPKHNATDRYQGWVRTNIDVFFSKIHLPLPDQPKLHRPHNRHPNPVDVAQLPSHCASAKEPAPPKQRPLQSPSAGGCSSYAARGENLSPDLDLSCSPSLRVSGKKAEVETDAGDGTPIRRTAIQRGRASGGEWSGAGKAAAHSSLSQSGLGVRRAQSGGGGKGESTGGKKEGGVDVGGAWMASGAERGEGCCLEVTGSAKSADTGNAMGGRQKFSAAVGPELGELYIPKKRARGFSKDDSAGEKKRGVRVWDLVPWDPSGRQHHAHGKQKTKQKSIVADIASPWRSVAAYLLPSTQVQQIAEQAFDMLCEMLRHISCVLDSESKVLDALRESQKGRAKGTGREQWEAYMEVLRAVVYGVVLVYLGLKILRIGEWIWGVTGVLWGMLLGSWGRR